MQTQLTETSGLTDRVSADLKHFGFYGPVPLLSPAECTAVEEYLSTPDAPRPLTWFKGHAATNAGVHEIASRPEITALLRPLLGDDIVLWGAMLIRRLPDTRQVWHSDMETSDPGSRAISVWIGLRNTSSTSGLRFVTRSHLFGRPAQDVAAEQNVDRFTVTDEQLLEVVRKIDPAAQIDGPDCRDGDMVLFDGRLWHAGYNSGTPGTRTALLLQYAAADNPIPMPLNADYAWPWKVAESPRVPTVLVSGSARRSANRIVPPPMRPLKEVPMAITTVAKSIAVPLAEDATKRWRAYPQFSGRTAALNIMSCHVSVLSAGHRPHPPHTHEEEELLVMLDGEVEVELADDPNGTAIRRHHMAPGMFSYYPIGQHHTIHNVSARPASYLMFKWRGGVADSETPLCASIFKPDAAVVEQKAVAQKLLFEQPTHSLSKLQAHLTTLRPAAGYAPHADPYDVGIVLLSGEVETVGAGVRAPGIIYYAAGQAHGIRNVGAGPATYLVFEFHSPLTADSAKQESKKKGDLVRRLVRRLSKFAGRRRRR